MTTVAKKLMLGTAAFAVAGALISPVVAVADTEDSGTDSVGTSAGNTPKRDKRGAVARAEARNGGSSVGSTSAGIGNSTAPAAEANDAPETPDIPAVGAGDAPADIPTSAPSTGAKATADATAFDNPLFQNPLIWIGTPNPAPPTPIVEFETLPLEDVSEPLRGAFGWMQDFEFEACVLGLSSVTRGQNVVGPYGTATTGFSSSGCA